MLTKKKLCPMMVMLKVCWPSDCIAHFSPCYASRDQPLLRQRAAELEGYCDPLAHSPFVLRRSVLPRSAA
jgi:hypothetical protein